MPLKIDLNYQPEQQQYYLKVGDGKHSFDVWIGENSSTSEAAKTIEMITNHYTLTTSHRDIYKNAYNDLDKKYLKLHKELNDERIKYKQLLHDHQEILGILA